ncbi:hypothetical protein DTO212C5_7414 [Paecilomyces variotii]|nr:hypothetical protein DTO212C5_7414 [Paecilomyces variotii]
MGKGQVVKPSRIKGGFSTVPVGFIRGTYWASHSFITEKFCVIWAVIEGISEHNVTRTRLQGWLQSQVLWTMKAWHRTPYYYEHAVKMSRSKRQNSGWKDRLLWLA